MDILHLLFVEDNDAEFQTFEQTLDRYSIQYDRKITFTRTANLEETQEALKKPLFDGAVVDLRLKNDGEAGNKLLLEIIEHSRIPVAIYTATPENVDKEFTDRKIVKIFRRGVGYDLPLNFLFEIFNTGLTRIFGGRGYIEDKMNKVFWNNIIPNLEIWTTYKSQGKNTEEALLRFIINHIVEIVDEEAGLYFHQEMYISPVISKALKTGSIVKVKKLDEYYIVLSPACDLANHNGEFKTDRILVCAIQATNQIINEHIQKQKDIQIQESDSDKIKQQQENKQNKVKSALSTKIVKNKHTEYFHYLPKTEVFLGGLINFRMVETFQPEKFKENFEEPSAQISSAFIKDVVARFSSYYARQGQPDFDFDNLTL